ncbi:MAG TPA: alpha/beta fold hydrolase [Planctomycetota bacterium]|nr:alpha/beta fold hydrolase [Planctomycetota bacterium]
MDRVSFHALGIDAVGAEQGSSDPLLLVPGWGGGASNWRRVWPSLVTRYRCIAPDLPGWGDSEKPDVPYTFEWYADWLAALLDSRSASPAFVAGHSMGATLALVFALRHPGRVTRLALLNPIIRGSDGLRKGARFLSAPGIRRVVYPFTRSRAFLRFLSRHFTNAEQGLEETDLLLVGRGSFASMTRWLNAAKAVDLTGSLRSVTAPTLVVGSDADREIPPVQTALAGGIPGARVVTLKGCGHVSLLERPAEVASLLVDHFGPGALRGRPPGW